MDLKRLIIVLSLYKFGNKFNIFGKYFFKIVIFVDFFVKRDMLFIEKGVMVMANKNFDRFSNVDDGFVKTQIPIAHFFVNGNPVSRSEARRLGELIVKFKEINLDFAGVDEVGQAFCHELFIVWQNRNPDSVLNILNACDDVERMIKRVKNTK